MDLTTLILFFALLLILKDDKTLSPSPSKYEKDADINRELETGKVINELHNFADEISKLIPSSKFKDTTC